MEIIIGLIIATYIMIKIYKIVIVYIIELIKKYKNSTNVTYSNINSNENIPKTTNNDENYKEFYNPKIYLITLNELVFHNVLLEIAKELNLILCSQVSLYNIIETKKGLDKSNETKYFNKISRKSIDFVLVDKKDCRIRLCIELDDNTHKKYNRIERDKFVNKLFEDLNINLLRVPSRFHYNKEELKKLIENNISKRYYEYN